MRNFQQLIANSTSWIRHRIETVVLDYRKSVERQRDEALRRRFLNG